ncbi:MAG: S41 family peptidase [Thermonemataceae bacterium]
MKKISTISLLLSLLFHTLSAQETKRYKTNETTATITIDGKLQEKSWEAVQWAGDFIQTQPNKGEKPTYATQFKILFDQHYLFVAIRAFDAQPDSIVMEEKPRDFFAGDYVEINIDSDFDKKDAFSFTITAAGIRGDEYIQTSNNWLNDWSPDWTAKTTRDEQGWIAELKIPLSALAVYTKQTQWGLQVNRRIARLDENSSWTKVTDDAQWVASFGLLQGITGIPVAKRFLPTDKIDAKLLQNDFSGLHRSLQSSYPSLYRYRSESFINHHYQQTLEALTQPITLLDFYKIVASYLSKIGDGHMKVKLPAYFASTYNADLKRLPFQLKTTTHGVFVTENYSADTLLNDAQLVSINGQAIQKILHDIAELIPADGHNLTGKYHQMAADFDFYYSLVDGLEESTQIDFILKGQQKVISANIPLLTTTALEQIKATRGTPQRGKPFDYKLKNNIGVMTLRTFNYPKAFQKFVDESFQQLVTSKIDKLILDLRGNGGGEEVNAIYLYTYLTTKPFKYYDRYEVNVAPHKKVEQASTLVSYETLNFFASIVSLDSAGRRIITDLAPLKGNLLDPTTWQQPKVENNFTGKVVVLIDGGSFSATSEICAIMKRDKRATFVGTETGGTYDGTTSGIYDRVTLPHSKLQVKIPLIKYVSALGTTEYWYGRGIMPDYPIIDQALHQSSDKDRVMDFAIMYLQEAGQASR